MIFALVTLPIMLFAVAVATIPVLHTMLRDERHRRQAREAQPTAEITSVQFNEKTEDFESALVA